MGIGATDSAGPAIARVDGGNFCIPACPAPRKAHADPPSFAEARSHGDPSLLANARPLVDPRACARAGAWIRPRTWCWSALYLRGATLYAALGNDLRSGERHHQPSREQRQSQQSHPATPPPVHSCVKLSLEEARRHAAALPGGRRPALFHSRLLGPSSPEIAAHYAATMISKPPKIMRLASKGIFSGLLIMFLSRGSFMTLALMRSRSARDL